MRLFKEIHKCFKFLSVVARNIGSAFFQSVGDMEVRIVYKGGTVGGVFGAGKEGKRAEADPQNWTRDRAHLYDSKAQATVGALQNVLPKDVIGMIIDSNHEKRPLTLFAEKSLFPSPISGCPGQQKGGWVLVELEGEAGVVEVQLEYTRLDGKAVRLVKEFDTHACDGSDEGMQKAIVLKTYVDEVKKTLANKSATTFDSEFVAYFKEQSQRFDLAAQVEQLTQLQKVLDK